MSRLAPPPYDSFPSFARIDRRKDDRSINLNALRAPVTALTLRRP
jgi:hypothetical protein